MHTWDSPSTNSNVPAFLVKLWKLVEDSDCDDLISWSEKGNSFIIRDQTTFAKKLLPLYFKHNNMASFIRQLNMYGFKKLVNYEKGGLKMEQSEMEFHHPFFLRGHPLLLEMIKRKISSAKSETNVRNAQDLLTDLTTIREKQESMDTKLMNMKKENELLWRELSAMRQKHKAQEQIIQKVIQFLVSIVQGSKQNIGSKRKLSRMIHEGPSSEAKAPRLSRQLELLRGKGADIFLTVAQDKLTNADGPVIHEVTDFDHEESCETTNAVVPTNISSSVQDDLIECVIDPDVSSPANDITEPLEPLCMLEPLKEKSPLLLEDNTTTNEEQQQHILSLPVDFPDANVISLPEELSPADSATTAALTPDVIFSPSLNLEDDAMVASTEEIVTTDCINDTDSKTEKENIGSPEILSLSGEIINESEKNSEEKSPECSVPQCSSPSTSNFNVKDIMLCDSNIPSINLQLALSDSSNSSPENSITKNTFSNHVLNIDEKLDQLHEFLKSGSLNIDTSNLLGLFSTDDIANNPALISQFTTDENNVLKNMDTNSIVGNELVQFTPSILELDLEDIGTPMFLDHLCENPAESFNFGDGESKAGEEQNTINLDELFPQSLMSDLKSFESPSASKSNKKPKLLSGTSPKPARGKCKSRRKK